MESLRRRAPCRRASTVGTDTGAVPARTRAAVPNSRRSSDRRRCPLHVRCTARHREWTNTIQLQTQAACRLGVGHYYAIPAQSSIGGIPNVGRGCLKARFRRLSVVPNVWSLVVTKSVHWRAGAVRYRLQRRAFRAG